MNRVLKAKIIERYGSQANFAQAIKEHEPVISRVVRNRMDLPPETKAKWANALGCRVEEVFKGIHSYSHTTAKSLDREEKNDV